MNRRWIWWLVVALAIPLLGYAIAYFIVGSVGPDRAPSRGEFIAFNSVLGVTALLSLLWTCYGLWSWRERRWVQWAAALFFGSLVVLGLFLLLQYQRYPATAVGIAGVWAMLVMFLVGIFLVRLVLTPGHPVLGVARTLVDEALRMKIALIFILVLLVFVPVLPLILDPAERLQYRMQMYLNYGVAAIAILLALMTIFLTCATITGEIGQRQIFLTMTKPVGRAQYLLGKWLGIALLNLVLVSIGGLGLYAFARILEVQGARERADRLAVSNQVLVARNVINPATPEGLDLNRRVADRARELHANDPQNYGDPISPKQHQELRTAELAKWHTIAPRSQQTYVFRGVDAAKPYADVVQLRIKPRILPAPPDENARLVFFINDRMYITSNPLIKEYPMQWVGKQNTYHVIDLPIRDVVPDEGPDKGVMRLRIAHVDAGNEELTFSTSVAFEPGEGLQLLFQVGTFEGNLVRGLFLIWLSLCFLCMLGLAAGTFLGFPVACVLCLAVFIGGMSTTFLYESVSTYGIANVSDTSRSVVSFGAFFGLLGEGRFWDAFQVVVGGLARIVLWVTPELGEYYPGPYLVDGRMIPGSLITGALLKIGLICTGACGVAGWLIFRARELARVIV